MLHAVWGAARPRPALVALLGLCLCLGLVAEPPPAAAQEAESGPVPGAGALVAADALLRTQPGYDAAVVTPLLPGTPVDVLGGPIADPGGTRWYSVSFGGQAGFLPAGALAPGAPPAAESATEPSTAPATVPIAEPPAPPTDPAADLPVASDSAPAEPSPPSPATATATDLLNLRAGPSYDDEILRVLPPGAPVSVTGPAQGGFLPVAYDGTLGWIDAAYLTTGAAAPAPVTDQPPAAPADAAAVPEAAAAAPAGAATITAPLNLRAGPAASAPVLLVMPAGAVLQPTGAPQDGFYPVAFGGQTGWASADYLSFEGDAASPAALAPAPSAAGAGIAWPFAGGTWEVIQGYNNGTHTYRGPTADYRYSLDLARSDGDTAGQPIYAPLSGTVRWSGNGGILIDAGNGLGVAMFHLTLDGFSSRQSVQQGQRVGVISGPGGPGYAGTPHVDLTLWQLGDGANVSTPFTGSNAIAGQDFPDTGAGNAHMGVTVTP